MAYIEQSQTMGGNQNEEEFVVEKILDRRNYYSKKRITEYLVRWEGYTAEHDTWEPEGNLGNCMDLVNEFNNQRVRNRASPAANSKYELIPVDKLPSDIHEERNQLLLMHFDVDYLDYRLGYFHSTKLY